MPWIVIRVTPTDYDAWHEVHTSQLENLRTKGTVRSEVITRDQDDPRTLVLIQQCDDLKAVQDFLALPEIQEVIAKAPIEGPPSFWMLEELERPI